MKNTKQINKKLLKGSQAEDYKGKVNEYFNESEHCTDINYYWKKWKQQ